MLKKIDHIELEKYLLLASDKYAYKEIVNIILETITDVKDSSSKEIPNFFDKNSNNNPSDVLKILFTNPYFPDNEKLELLTRIKESLNDFKNKINDFKNNNNFYLLVFDFTNSVFVNEKSFKKQINELFPFYKEAIEYNLLALQDTNKKSQEFFQLIDQAQKLFLFKKYNDGKIPEIDEAIRKNISLINKMIKIDNNYINKLPAPFFEFLSSSWFKEFDDFKKDSIKDDVLNMLNNENIEINNKRKILSYLYTHIKLDKKEKVDFVLKPYINSFLDSINIVENEKYRKTLYKNIAPNYSSLLNESRFFQKEFYEDNSLIGRLFYTYSKIILKSEYDIMDTFIKHSPIADKNIKEFKSLDFMFKRKDFDITFFTNQYFEIRNNYMEAYNNNPSDEMINNLLLKLSKFLSFSYQNIYLMNHIYTNDKKLFQEFVDTYKTVVTKPLLSSSMAAYQHFVYTDFNVNHFLDMNQEFKETYLENLKNIMQNIPNKQFHGYDNLLKIFQKEPNLLEIFQDAKVNPNIKSDGYKMYLNDIKEYSKILSTYFIDSSIDNDEKFKVLEKLKNSIEIDTNYNFPNLQF